jgi:hypothetical protein
MIIGILKVMADNNNLTTGQSNQEPVTPADSPYDSPFSEFDQKKEAIQEEPQQRETNEDLFEKENPNTQTEDIQDPKIQQPPEPEPTSEIKESATKPEITEEVATATTDFQTPPPSYTPPQYQSPNIPTETPEEKIPASLPTNDGLKKTSSITTLVLAILAIFAVAGAAFLFLRSQFLKSQLTNIISTKQNQQITETTPTPEPTTEPAKVPQTIATPTPANTIAPQATYPYLEEVIKMADSYATDNQLLMITADNANSPYQIQIKYWFRTQDDNGSKKYFYILHQPAEDLSLFDKQIYVTPDNDIPDIKTKAQEKALGIDLDQALKTSKEKILDNSSIESSPDSISAQYIETNSTLLWQLVYNYTDRTTPIVIQVNANNQEIIYSNINYNK